MRKLLVLPNSTLLLSDRSSVRASLIGLRTGIGNRVSSLGDSIWIESHSIDEKLVSWLCKQFCKIISNILICGNVVELYTVTENFLMNKMIVNIKVLDSLTFYRIFCCFYDSCAICVDFD